MPRTVYASLGYGPPGSASEYAFTEPAEEEREIDLAPPPPPFSPQPTQRQPPAIAATAATAASPAAAASPAPTHLTSPRGTRSVDSSVAGGAESVLVQPRAGSFDRVCSADAPGAPRWMTFRGPEIITPSASTACSSPTSSHRRRRNLSRERRRDSTPKARRLSRGTGRDGINAIIQFDVQLHTFRLARVRASISRRLTISQSVVKTPRLWGLYSHTCDTDTHAASRIASRPSSRYASSSLEGVQSLGTCTATPPLDRNTRTLSSP